MIKSAGSMSKFLTIFLVILLKHSCGADENNDEKILNYLSENNFLQGKSEIVFLLDRSGSVGAANFEIQKGFVESLLTQVIVDVNATRVAVVSYSDDVVRHIDYLREPKNKCFLSEELVNVNFENSGATNIAAALDEALDVFQNARLNVNKVVILISDGLATTGGNPVPHADQLKQTGVQIFAFGVGRFLKTELLSLATSERHIYSCSAFKEFKTLAKKIRGDPHETSWSGQASTPNCDHLCHSPYKGSPHDPGCCDHSARCSCALLSGMHTCVCGPGFPGHCRACPKGTYKFKTEPTEKCELCPVFSTTLKVGSKSIKDCFCKDGYYGNISAGIPCTAVRCPTLQKPTNGFILGDCRNAYGSSCYFMCEDGFELVDKSSDIRTCRSDGTWTEKSALCQKIHCNALLTPTYGRKHCDRNDLTVGTKCKFSCFPGFLMEGSKDRECLPSKVWSGKDVACLARECPIPQSLKYGNVYGCRTDQKGRFDETCVFGCTYGYELIGSRSLTCNAFGKWTNSTNQEERVYCKDIHPPQIKCPGPIKLLAKSGRDYTTVRWEIPRPNDNSGYEPKLRTNPPDVNPPLPFLIGVTRFDYIATDMSGLSSKCTVKIEVVDREPPKVVSCPSNVEVSATDGSAIVKWEQPVFQDNDGKKKLIIKKNHEPGDSFNIGRNLVIYEATDGSGNHARCEFNIIVSRTYCPYYPPPTNGAFTCDDWMNGQFCQVFCNEKFDFVHKPADWYVCNGETKWVTDPPGLSIPWPDCARPSFPSKIRKMLSGFYYAGDCNDPKVQMVIKKQFLNHFTQRFRQAGLCNFKGGCSVDKVKVKCGKTDKTLGLKRHRRNVVEFPEEELEVEFDIIINVDHHEFNNTDDVFDEFMETIKNLQWDIEEDFNRDVTTHSSLGDNEIGPEENSKILVLTKEKTTVVCQPGSVLTDELCVSCSPGTFYSREFEDCMDCAIGYYQNKEGQMNCEMCPEGTSTEYPRTREATECKGVCPPGTYSASGLETCLTCPVGSFQDTRGATTCLACPNSTTTTSSQTTSITECKEACNAGSYSESGLMPCDLCPKHYFQPETQQQNCLECPIPLSTMTEGAESITDCIDYDPCDNSSSCANGGQCMRSGRKAVCRCSDGFSGDRCEIKINVCEEQPCENNSTCMDIGHSYICFCNSGFEGINCENETNECLSNPCLNNGTCVDQLNGYKCICGENYEGDTCEYHVAACFHDVTCLNEGICDRETNSSDPQCICCNGYDGADCSININDCHNVTCNSHGRCVDGVASYTCDCNEEYTGIDCENEVDECQNNLCSSGSTCKGLIGSYQCVCSPGWSGSLCENKLDSNFVLMFPEDQASIANMASTTISTPLSKATVSMWLQTTDTHRSGTPFSYAVSTSSIGPGSRNTTIDNALTISDCSGVEIYVNNEPMVTDVNVADGQWHHLAFTWSSENSGSWNLYKDGQLQSIGHLQAQDPIAGGGVVVIGQEQDTLGGGFSPLESFTGNITRVNVWNSYFSPSNVSRLFELDDDIPGKVVSWPDFLSNVKGNVEVLRNHNAVNFMKPNV